MNKDTVREEMRKEVSEPYIVVATMLCCHKYTIMLVNSTLENG